MYSCFFSDKPAWTFHQYFSFHFSNRHPSAGQIFCSPTFRFFRASCPQQVLFTNLFRNFTRNPTWEFLATMSTIPPTSITFTSNIQEQPSGYVKIAIENDHRNSGIFPLKMVIFHSYVTVYQRESPSSTIDPGLLFLCPLQRKSVAGRDGRLWHVDPVLEERLQLRSWRIFPSLRISGLIFSNQLRSRFG